jgi:hypothetical protein
MHLGDENHLAAVGIALNIGFGILDQFRNWLRKLIADRVRNTTNLLLEALGEQPDTKRGVESLTNKISLDFESTADRLQPVFVFITLGAAAALLAFMGLAVAYAETACSGRWTIPVMAFTIVPLLTWWALLARAYRKSKKSLAALLSKYKAAVDAFKSLKECSIAPTPPGDSGNNNH